MRKHIFLLAIAVTAATMVVECYITRLPDRIHGRFDVKVADTYVTGELVSTYNQVNETYCEMLCLTHAPCEFVNHAQDDSQCDLMSGLTGATKQTRVGWNYISTNQTTKNKGQYCEIMNPCKTDWACEDVPYSEDPNGYKCTDLPNVANGKTATGWDNAGESLSLHSTNFLTDSDTVTSGYCHNPCTYVRIDLGRVLTVDFIAVFFHKQSDSAAYDRSFWIQDGLAPEADALCNSYGTYHVLERVVVCVTDIPGQRRYLTGRYVLAGWKTLVSPTNMYFREIIVIEKL